MSDLHEHYGLVPEETYLRLRGVKRRRAQWERMHRVGPAFVRIGRKVFYRPEAIAQFFAESEVKPVRRNSIRKSPPHSTGRKPADRPVAAGRP